MNRAHREGPIPCEPTTARFASTNPGFRLRSRIVNSILEQWPIVCGTGSWLEAHLVGRLGLTDGIPGLVGCGISEQEVWQLSQTLEQQGLVILSDSIAADRGIALIQRLRRGPLDHRVLLLVQDYRSGGIQALLQLPHQGAPLAMVHVESFGSGVGIRALVALRAGRSYSDPRLRDSLQLAKCCEFTTREAQTLQRLGRGLSNKAIASELGIAPETVRDYVSGLLRKLGASNRTEALGKAMAMGLLHN